MDRRIYRQRREKLDEKKSRGAKELSMEIALRESGVISGSALAFAKRICHAFARTVRGDDDLIMCRIDPPTENAFFSHHEKLVSLGSTVVLNDDPRLMNELLAIPAIYQWARLAVIAALNERIQNELAHRGNGTRRPQAPSLEPLNKTVTCATEKTPVEVSASSTVSENLVPTACIECIPSSQFQSNNDLHRETTFPAPSDVNVMSSTEQILYRPFRKAQKENDVKQKNEDSLIRQEVEKIIRGKNHWSVKTFKEMLQSVGLEIVRGKKHSLVRRIGVQGPRYTIPTKVWLEGTIHKQHVLFSISIAEDLAPLRQWFMNHPEHCSGKKA